MAGNATYTDAQYEVVFATFKGTYAATASAPKLKAYAGDTAAEMFEGLRAAGYSTAVSAQVVIEAWIRMGVVKSVAAVDKQLGEYVIDTGKATENVLPSWSVGLASFLGNLESASTWERAAEVALGLTLIAVGAAHLLGLKAPKAVPVPV